MGLIIRNKFTVKATEISKVCISSGAVRFPITTFRHPVGCRKLLCRHWCMPVGWMYWWYSEVLFRMLNWVQTLLKKKKKKFLLAVIPQRLTSGRFLITKLMQKYAYLQNGYSGHASITLDYRNTSSDNLRHTMN